MRAANTMSKPFIKYLPGDHIGIFPSNDSRIVDALLNRTFKDNGVKGAVLTEDSYFQVSPVVVVQTRDSLEDSWVNSSRLPPCTLKEALTHYLDISSCPTPRLLNGLSGLANDRWDVFRLKKLSQEPESYKVCVQF